MSGTAHAAVKPPSVRKVAGRGSSPQIGRSPSNPQLAEPESARAPLSSSDLIEVPPSTVEAATPTPSTEPTTFRGSERSLVIDLPGTRAPVEERPTMPAVTPPEVVSQSERSVEVRVESISHAAVDSTSAITAPVEAAAPFVSALATPTTPQDETFIVRRKARKNLPVLAGALALGAAAAFFAVDGASVLRRAFARVEPKTAAATPPPFAAAPPVASAASPPTALVAAPAPPPAAAQVAPPAPASASAASDIPQGKGALKTDSARPGRRIFVNGRVVGQTPATVLVACGLHDIKIGSSGRTSQIDIPCQGEVALGD